MVAGIVLTAFGLEESLPHLDEHLHVVPAFALLGGVAVYLLAHVALRLRNAHTISRTRLGVALLLLFALWPLATEVERTRLVDRGERGVVADDRVGDRALRRRSLSPPPRPRVRPTELIPPQTCHRARFESRRRGNNRRHTQRRADKEWCTNGNSDRDLGRAGHHRTGALHRPAVAGGTRRPTVGSIEGRTAVNKDSGPSAGVKGIVEDVKGKVKEVAGEVTGDESLEQEGHSATGQGVSAARRGRARGQGRGGSIRGGRPRSRAAPPPERVDAARTLPS